MLVELLIALLGFSYVRAWMAAEGHILSLLANKKVSEVAKHTTSTYSYHGCRHYLVPCPFSLKCDTV
jgi:hypothetical protein